MEYIIFLITIQLPVIYLFWKMVNNHQVQSRRTLQKQASQIKNIANSMDILRLSIEKLGEDTYARIQKMESRYGLMDRRLHQLEKHTGLRSSSKSLESPVLENKDLL